MKKVSVRYIFLWNNVNETSYIDRVLIDLCIVEIFLVLQCCNW